jgi:hypothetical protein
VQEPGDPQDMNWDLWKPIKDIIWPLKNGYMK